MMFELQPILQNETVRLIPLKSEDFERLHKVASDQLIWEQHPDRFRYKRDVFEKFFESAIESKGAFLVLDKQTKEVIGSSRYYDYDENKKSIAIGFTFLAQKYWGTDYNRAMKNLMLDHAFKFVETVIFHVGENNFRSQKAVEKLGAVKIGTINAGKSQPLEQSRLIYSLNWKTWKEHCFE